MSVDPHAWLITVPLTLAFLQAYLLPRDHRIKQFVRELNRREAMAWEQIGLPEQPLNLARSERMQRGLVLAIIAGLGVTSIASFVVFVA